MRIVNDRKIFFSTNLVLKREYVLSLPICLSALSASAFFQVFLYISQNLLEAIDAIFLSCKRCVCGGWGGWVEGGGGYLCLKYQKYKRE